MNLRDVNLVTLFSWKGSDKPSGVINKRVSTYVNTEIKRKVKELGKSSDSEKIGMASKLVKSGVTCGREAIDDVFKSLKIVGLPRTVVNVNSVYFKAFGESNIYPRLSPYTKRTIRKTP